MFTTSESVRRPLHESYEVGPEIGRGSYGSVLSATNRETGVVCAVKVIQKDKVMLLLLLLLEVLEVLLLLLEVLEALLLLLVFVLLKLNIWNIIIQ